MPRITYVNGQYLPHREAAVHVEDRGYQFADGVYEVIAVRGGGLVDEDRHLGRLDRSLGELRLAAPVSGQPLKFIMREIIRRNRVRDGKVYLQITRGVAPRDHPFPAGAESSLVVYALPVPQPDPETGLKGISVITVPDIRWRRCDIKSISLLPNVLAKQSALDSGAGDAWLVDDDGVITEGSAANAWIVTRDGELVTRHLDNFILGGITRIAVIELAEKAGVRLVERAFGVEEAKQAKEAFLTSSTSYVKPVVAIDDTVIGNGEAGEVTRGLYHAYEAHMDSQGANGVAD